MCATRISVIVFSAAGSAIMAMGMASTPVAAAQPPARAPHHALTWYSTYLGGKGGAWAKGAAVDGRGNLYVVGGTRSRHFPTVHAFQAQYRGAHPDTSLPLQGDAFVAKFSPTGKLVYSTYLGGTAGDEANGVAVDAVGDAYVTGVTHSSDFPTLHPLQRHCQVVSAPDIEPCDVGFVAKFGPAGHLLWSTFFGADQPQSIAVDSAGAVVIAGADNVQRVPVVNAIQPHPGGAFVAKFNAVGTHLIYSTYLGGSGFGEADAVAVDQQGNAYVTGMSDSGDFPPGFGRSHAPHTLHLFVAKLDSWGRLVYLFARDASQPDVDGVETQVSAIAVDRQGQAYITGTTNSDQFPTLHAVQGSLGGGDCYFNGTITHPCSDAFIAKLDARGDHLLYSTYLGGSEDDTGKGIAVDARGDAIVTGAGGEHFPTMNPLQVGYGGGDRPPKIGGAEGATDAFVAKVSPSGSTLLFSTLLGGAGADEGDAVAVTPRGTVYVVGSTDSPDFPVHRALQPHLVGEGAAFVTRLPDTLSPLIHKHPVSSSSGLVTVRNGVIAIIIAVGLLTFGVRRRGRKRQAA